MYKETAIHEFEKLSEMYGIEIGILKVFYKENLLSEHKIYASSDVKRVNLISRVIKSINYLIWGDV